MAESDYIGDSGHGGTAVAVEPVSAEDAGLLGMKVSAILAANPAALGVLVEHGFTPLAQPYLRKLLAHTVTLEQALRLRPLAPEREKSLLDELELLVPQPVASEA